MSLNVKVKPQIHNRFDIFKENVKTGVKEQVGYAENIVLDAMWSRLCGGSTYFVNIHYGTGEGILSPARTSLFSHLGTGVASTVETVRAIPTSYWRRSITLGLTTANGNTLKEVGIAYSATASQLVTHAQIRDMNGNPTGIVKTDVDIITIYATVYITLVNDHASIKLLHPNSNGLLSYLLGGSFPSAVFSAGMSDATIDWPSGLVSYTIGSSGSGSWSADVANKKRMTSTMRFETTVNGHIKELGFSNIARLLLPATGIYSGLELSDVPVGTGDGVTDTFDLPSAYIDHNSIVAKVDGVVESATKQTTDCYIRTSMTFSGTGCSFSKDGLTAVSGRFGLSPEEVQHIYKYQNGEWIKIQELPSRFVNDILITANGSHLIVVSHNTNDEIYEYAEGSYVKTKTMNISSKCAYIDEENSKLYSVNSSTLSVYTVDENWNLTLDETLSVYSDTVFITLSPSGTTIVTGRMAESTLDLLRIYEKNSDTWTQVSVSAVGGYQYAYGNPLCVEFSYDEQYMFVGTNKSHSTNLNTGNLYKKGVGWTRVASVEAGLRCTAAKFYPNTYDLLISGLAIGFKKYNIANDSFEEEVTTNIFGYVTPYSENLSTGAITNDLSWLYNSYGGLYEKNPIMTQITFSAPPAEGAVITADYTVNGIHKTSQRVIDVSGEVQFGEPT